ncbi:MAG: hypothetical protein H7Y17_06865 [Chlorobia bacterium]|nr:hypothetical protein [Fimbriimonadaceae bacterium]
MALRLHLLFCVCFFSATLSFAGLQLESKVVGTWKYDTKSIRVELSAESKAKFKKEPKKAQAAINQMKGQMATLIAPMTVMFNKDSSFLVFRGTQMEGLKGRWSIKGRSIRVVMDNAAQKVPELTLSSDGKRIQTAYRQASFGVGRVDLVKK